ncbi:exo-rhamnogalacturonan lyase family protein [Amphibacillus sediminis]|uniref:exo-rhamnogalacturonan lyase family protein n=1 Tax=Amphibacillus sediminis TaxID=360185 RepID=UPI00082B4C0F|nr:hypothetical protein [Amphibacillus sediminis]
MKLKWLEDAPKVKSGVTFGLPWKKGELPKLRSFSLNQYKVQSWPTAYWPDGSIKWTAHSAVVNPNEVQVLQLKEEHDTSLVENSGLTITELADQIVINTGCLSYYLSKSGPYLINKVVDQKQETVAHKGKLIVIMQEKQIVSNRPITIDKEIDCEIQHVVIEREGPLQATVKITGTCGQQNQLPFSVRFVFYHQLSRIKVLHTVFYNGCPEKDIVKGLGFQLSTKLIGQPYNRQIRLATQSGLYNEPAQLLTSRRFRQSELYQKQIKGDIIHPSNSENDRLTQAKGNAIWQDFKFTQISAQQGIFRKRTDRSNAWLNIPTISQTQGLLYAGGEDGGMAIALKDFNEKFPSQLAVEHLNGAETTLSIWFWSPDQEPMDLRHYSSSTHVQSAYEGFDEMRATPLGIANTSEAYVSFFDSPPSNEVLASLADYCQKPSLLISDPHYYYQSGATGVWPLKDDGNDSKRYLEEQLDRLIAFYKKEIKQRQWFGYWNYGDIMHSYDAVRKQWFYDMGGYAWQNTELVPNLWLWYSFFRSGDAEIFRIVEAMTRHNSEVDRYHFGEYKGLGSRHNVSHWGCGCKEARISMACLYKYYYYLTADERMLELLEEAKDADHTLEHLDPMREFYPKENELTHARIGPDWAAFCSNWMSKWERTQDSTYLAKILTGLDTIKETPYRLLSGPTFQYDPKTAELSYMGVGNEGGYHMIIAFGAPQVWLELADLLEDEVFKDMIAEFGQVYAMSDQEKHNFSNGSLTNHHFNWPMFASGLIGYAASRFNDAKLAEKAWELLLNPSLSGVQLPIERQISNNWAVLTEIPWVTTNVASQWSLNLMLCLRFIGDYLDEITD